MKPSHTTSIFFLIFSLLAFRPSAATAAEVRTGERVHIAADTVINEDLYAAAREVVIDGVVHGDVVTAGSRLIVHGRVDGSLMAAGGAVIVDGAVGRAARLVGGEVRVDGEVGGDALAACGSCTIGSAGKVGVDLFVAGGELNLAGAVARGLWAAGGKVRLAGNVKKDAQVRAGTLLVDASAAMPALLYGAQEPAQITSGARIDRIENHPEWAPAKPNRAAGSLLGALMALVTGAGLLFVMRASATSASQLMHSRPGSSLLWGLVMALAAPVLIVLGMVTVVAIPISMLVAALFCAGMYLGYLSSAHFLGELLLKRMQQEGSPFAAFALGILVLWLASLLPAVGSLIGALATLAGLGSLGLLLTSSRWFAARFRHPHSVSVSNSARV